MIPRWKDEIETPALVVDLDTMERNLRRMAEYFRDREANLRPHTKTHKCPVIAHKQLELGACGITCAKLSEAEVMAFAGIRDILIANQVTAPSKIRRLANLSRHTDLIVAVDTVENAHDISDSALEAGSKINVIIEIEVGMQRCGVLPEDAKRLAEEITRLPGIRFRGLMGYEGHCVSIKDITERREKTSEANSRLLFARDELLQAGIPVEIVSAGGTGTYNITGEREGITEVQAGSYVFMDATYVELVPEFEPAVTLIATVVSRPTRARVVIDAGLKAFSTGFGLPKPKDEKLLFEKLSEEHGRLRLLNGDLKVGDRLEFLPSHICTACNLHDFYYAVRRDRVEAVWRISARGKGT